MLDYKDISDRYDRQLVMDDMLMQSLVRQAVDKAIQFDNNPDKYYKYLDFSEIMKVQAISNFTMKNKLELISGGFMCYKIKQHIESLREQLNKKENKMERQIDISSKPSFLPKSKPNPQDKGSYQINNEPEYDQDYLDRNDLAICWAGKPIPKHLAEIEMKLGKSLSTLYP